MRTSAFLSPIAALIIDAVDRPRLTTNVTIVEDLAQRLIAMWSVQVRIYTRPLPVRDEIRDRNSTSVTGWYLNAIQRG